MSPSMSMYIITYKGIPVTESKAYKIQWPERFVVRSLTSHCTAGAYFANSNKRNCKRAYANRHGIQWKNRAKGIECQWIQFPFSQV